MKQEKLAAVPLLTLRLVIHPKDIFTLVLRELRTKQQNARHRLVP